jgi:hypothetical protein
MGGCCSRADGWLWPGSVVEHHPYSPKCLEVEFSELHIQNSAYNSRRLACLMPFLLRCASVPSTTSNAADKHAGYWVVFHQSYEGSF